MPGLFDLLTTAMGRPPPSMQLAQGMGQAPGQPGSPAGPNPLAPPPGGPGGAPAAGGAPGAPGGPPQQQQGQQQQPPQPQVYQSPPDLGQMYLQLAQRSQAEQSFNNGIAGLVGSIYPGRTSGALMSALRGNVQDPSEVFGNLVKLQMFNQQQQLFGQQIARYNDLVSNSDKYAKSFGIDPDMFKATIAAAGPQGAGDVLGKIAEAQMGITGTQTDKEYKQAIRNFQAANPSTPLPPELQTEAAFVTKQQGDITTAKQKADDLVADQHNFAPALTNYDKAIGLIDQFNSPEMQEGAKEFLGIPGLAQIAKGNLGSWTPPADMSAKGRAAWALYKQIMATQFAAGTQDFKGAGRITQSELTQDAPSQSTMGQLNQDPSDFFTGVQKYRDQLAEHRANLFGAAQKANDPRLSDADYTKYVAPNMDVFGGPTRTIKPSQGGDGGGGGGAALRPMPTATKQAAQDLISKDPTQREPLIQHLREQGIDPTGL